MAAMAAKFKGIRPRSKMLSVPYRNAGMKNYMERVSSMPVARQAAYSIGAPQFNGGRPIVIRHREYLQPITSVTAFTGAGRYIIQPGLVDNFPWLGQIAGAFENYMFADIKYVYRNRQGTTSNTTIYTATQYDVADPEFTSVEELMTYSGARSEVSWRDFAVDCNLRRGRAYRRYLVRTDALPSGQDYQPYDQALFTICAVGPSAGTYCGDLLVEYTIHLWNPKLNPNLLGAYGVNSGFTAASGSALAATPLLGYNANKTNYFPSSAEPVVDEAKSTITFPQVGAYDIGLHSHGAGGTQTTRFVATNTDDKAVFADLGGISSSGQGVSDWVKVVVNAAGAVINIAAVVTSPSATAQQVWAAISVEALSATLNFISKSPTLVVTDGQLAYLRRHLPKHDMAAFVRANESTKRREAKRIAPALRVEEYLEERYSDVESEPLEVHIPARRSHSSDRKPEKKG